MKYTCNILLILCSLTKCFGQDPAVISHGDVPLTSSMVDYAPKLMPLFFRADVMPESHCRCLIKRIKFMRYIITTENVHCDYCDKMQCDCCSDIEVE